MKKFFLKLYQKFKTFNSGKELFYEKDYARIRINRDDDLPLNKQ